MSAAACSKKRLLQRVIVFSFIAILIFFTGCSRREQRSVRSWQLGTLVELSVFEGGGSNILRDAVMLISAYEDKLSRTQELSEISMINRNAGISPVKVSDDTFYIISKSLYYSELSNGFFDITIGPLVSLWGIGTAEARVPSVEEINNAISLIDYRKVRLTPSENLVFLEEKGMEIDLGGIAKGFIADKVFEFFIEAGVKSAIINLGGDIRLLGRRPEGRPFRVGIQNPFAGMGEYLGIYHGENISIVASGVYERFFEEDGVRYHHIFNPNTGFPADNDIMGLSVITAQTADADAVSTFLFMLGARGALEVAERLRGVEVIIITEDKRILLSSGIGDSFTLLNNDFVIAGR
ncbi:MAG: FAD:protein FMN transferase [Spirochaetaceae bacterium]|nr:FAD:protein FMN transferase [Spirochaetaceae bacterium]